MCDSHGQKCVNIHLVQSTADSVMSFLLFLLFLILVLVRQCVIPQNVVPFLSHPSLHDSHHTASEDRPGMRKLEHGLKISYFRSSNLTLTTPSQS